jgi:hypothetical protein
MDAADSAVTEDARPACRTGATKSEINEMVFRTRLKIITLAGVLLAAAFPLQAHVGSPDVFYEGNAGAYRLFVTVRVPQVIPGVAEIEIRSETGDVREVRVVPMRLAGPGSNYPPTPDIAERSKDDPQFFSASLWLMESGALQVRALVDGAQGHGEMSVPVPSFAQRTLPMQKPLGALLLGLMLFLAIGVVFIVGAIVREGNLEGGEVPSDSRKKTARRAMLITAILVAAILFLGKTWWRSDAAAFQRRVDFFKPPVAALRLVDGHRLEIRTQRVDIHSRFYSPLDIHLDDLIPDHGHLMHLFLLRVPEMDRMWHLHPDPAGGGAFAVDLPDVPAGHYQVFADVVDPRGYPWTLVGTIDLPEIAGRPLAGDDSMWSGSALVAKAADSAVSLLPDGGKIVWQRPRGALKANVPLEFKFLAEDRGGRPVQSMEPYMGMAAHAEIVRSDLSVFAHVHPAGSVSMAALELAQAELPGGASSPESAMSMPMDMSMQASGPLPPEVHFPYGFPQTGDYRIFVQIKRAGRVETGVFDVHVK